MRNHTGKLCLLAALLTFSQFASAQYSTTAAITPAGVATAPASGASFEQYNGFNGGLALSIPLHHIGGRGEAGLDLVWNLQPNWIANHPSPDSGEIQVDPFPSSNTYPGGQNFLGLNGPGFVYIRSGVSWTPCSGGGYLMGGTLTTIVFVAPNGSQTTLVDTNTNGAVEPVPNTPACSHSQPGSWE